ncbi:hypothetical protein B0H14DRAFT_2920775 [Mycena olivaceomarginata]|nr:hypothetical protein B0H14DRAFT_2920775 [Mycena olivaceomarginata]
MAENVLHGLVQLQVGVTGGFGTGQDGIGRAPQIREDDWSFGDTTGVPTVKIDDFCQSYEVDATILQSLTAGGISTVHGLFGLNDARETLKNGGMKWGHIAELRSALKRLMARYNAGQELLPTPAGGGGSEGGSDGGERRWPGGRSERETGRQPAKGRERAAGLRDPGC